MTTPAKLGFFLGFVLAVLAVAFYSKSANFSMISLFVLSLIGVVLLFSNSMKNEK